MNIESFLHTIQPELTIVAALFGFLLLFLKLYVYFFGYEKTLREENLDRVKDLLSNSKDVQIVAPLTEELKKNIELGYKLAVSSFYPKVFDPALKAKVHKLVDDDKAAEFASRDINDIAKELASQGLAQKTGDDLFIFLEKRYQKTAVFVAKYEKTKLFCRITWCSCLILAFLSAGAILLSIFPNITIVHFWIFTSILTFIVGVISYINLLINRHQLISDWERLQLYGDQN